MAGRVIEILVRVNDSQATASLRRLGATADAASARTGGAFRRVNTAMRSTGEAIASTGRMMTGIGLGVAAVGYVSVKAAANFQTAMTKINTQADVSKGKVDQMSAAVLRLGKSGQVQQGPTELANALYHIESVAAGTYPQLHNTTNAMAALKIASEGAAVGGSNLEDTTTALMGAMFASREPLSHLNQMMGLINATVGAGNLRLSDLTLALGRGVVPAFKAVGLQATDAFAAIALLSDSGVKASSAAAQLGTALHFLVKPSAQADKFLSLIGMSQYKMAQDLHKPKGLLVALRDLADHLKTYAGGLNTVAAGQVVSSILPGGRGRILLTILQNLDRYQGKISTIYQLQNTLDASYKTQSHTLSGQLHIAWAKINADLVTFGQTLIPIISKYLPPLLRQIEGLFKWFTNLPGPVKSFVVKLGGIMLIAGPILLFVGKWISLLSKVGTALVAIKAAWVGIKGAEIAAGAAGAAAGVAGGVGAGVAGAAGAAGAAGTAAAIARKGSFTAFLADKEAAAAAAGGGTMAGAIGAMAAPALLAAFLENTFGSNQFNVVKRSAAIHDINPRAAAFLSPQQRAAISGGAHGGLVTGQGIKRFQYGGIAGPDNIPAWLTAGEGVLNRTAMSGIGTGGLGMLNSGMGLGPGGIDQPIQITVNSILDGRLVARSVLQQTLRKAARGPSSLVGGQLTTGARGVGP